jgi:hypothetical protein
MDTFLNFVKTQGGLLVATASMIVAVVTLWFQRRHHVKSLTPVPNFLTNNYENQVGVKLRNAGVGPLLIEEFRASNGAESKDDIISWMPDAPKGIYWVTFTYNIDGWCIAPNHEVFLVKLTGSLRDDTFRSFRDDVRTALSKLTVNLKYKDIYDHRMPEKSRSLLGSFEIPEASDELPRPEEGTNLVVNTTK